MTTWTHGYVADIGYTYGYYAELNPLRSELALLNARVEPPEIRNACELGFGQGVSVNLRSSPLRDLISALGRQCMAFKSMAYTP